MELIIVTVVIILMLVVLGEYNSIKKLYIKVKQSKAGIDVYYQQRFDLIPNIVSVVKGYIEYEKETMENITKLRFQYNSTKDIKIGEELDDKVNKIMIVLENYPELKASEQFLNLQKNLSKMESQLQAARRIYNNDVTNYNTKIGIFPSNIFAKIFRFEEEKLFEKE